MEYVAIGFSLFIKELKEKVNKRIDIFAAFMNNEFKNNPKMLNINSKRQWMEEYKKWIVTDDIRKDILEYLIE